MNSIKRFRLFLVMTAGILLLCGNALATEYSPAYRVRSVSDLTGPGYNEVAATLHLPGNSDIKGVGETGAAYNYLGIEISNGKSLEIGLTKDKYDLESSRWSVFAYANYEGAFSSYGTEGRWVNFRRDGAAFAGPQLLVEDGSDVTISLKVLAKDEAVFEITGYEPVRLKIPGAGPQEEKQIFRRVTSLMTDDPQGYFRNTRWSSVKIKKSAEPYADWQPKSADIWQSNNMDKSDPHSSWVSTVMDNERIQKIDINMDGLIAENHPYAFSLRKKSDETMRVEFKGSQMFHGDRHIGFGVGGKPMLSLRYMAERFGFQVEYDSQEGACLFNSGEYSFRLKPGGQLAEIYWAGEKVREKELTEKPLLKKNVLYVYSLDISDLLGLVPYWDNSARTWDVLYRDYTYQELGFPTAADDDLLSVQGLLWDDGQHDMPWLEITDPANKVRSKFSSIVLSELGKGSDNKYEINCVAQLEEEISRLRVRLAMGQRIIFAKDIEVAMNIEAK